MANDAQIEPIEPVVTGQVPATPHKKLGRLLRVAAVICALSVVILAAIYYREAKEIALHAGEFVSSLGAFYYFAAFAVLPAFGCPITLFTLTVGATFVPNIGLPATILFSALAQAINLALSYWLARYLARPVFATIIKKLGYSVPEVARSDQIMLTIFLRFVPGPPHSVQCYLLGLAKVNFGIYMLISYIAVMGWTLVFILAGDAFMQGRAKTAVMAILLMIVLIAGTFWLRKRIAGKNKTG